MSEEYNVRVGVELDNSSFNNLKQHIDGKNVGKIKVNLDISDAKKQISALKKQIQSLGKEKVKINIDTSMSGGGKGGVGDGVKQVASEMKLVEKQISYTVKRINSLRVSLPKLNDTKDISGIRKQIELLERYRAELKSLKVEADNLGGLSDLKGLDVNEKFRDAYLQIAKTKAALEDLKRNAFEKIKLDLDTGNIDKNVADVRSKLINLEDATDETTRSVRDLVGACKDLDAAVGKGDYDEVIAAHEKYVNSLKKAQNQIKINQSLQKDWASEMDISAAQSKMDLWLQKNSNASADYGARIRELQNQLTSCDKVTLRNVMGQFQQLTREAEIAGKTGMKAADNIKQKIAQYSLYFTVASLAMESTQALKSMCQQVLEVDTAMTGLYRVTDLTDAQYDSLFNNMISSAKEYGTTLTDIINGTSDWVRAGFNAEESLGLSEITTMYQHIADLDYATATQNLLTAYKGFEGQFDNMFAGDVVASVNYIADILNELDNQYAVTAAGLGESLKRSAASMMEANNSIEQTAALVGAAQEVTQDPEGAGNAIKVVSMRLRGAKGELEDLGEEVDENVENITKMQGQILNLTHGKVNIFEDDGSFKSTYDILKGIHDVWEDLSDIEQADLLETIAGKHRANTVASILSNFDNAEAMYQSALNATGSAAQEHEKYVDSLQGRLNKLTTAWQAFSNTFMDSGFLKGIVGTATDLLNVLDGIVKTVGTFPAIVGVIAGAVSAFKNVGLFKRMRDDATGDIKSIELSVFGMTGRLPDAFAALKNNIGFEFDEAFDKQLNVDKGTLGGLIDSGALQDGIDGIDGVSERVERYIQVTDKASISVEHFEGYQKAMKATSDSSASTFKGVSNAIAAFNSITDRTGKTQQGFVDAIKAANPSLSSYINKVGAGKANIIGYGASLVGATIKTFALTAAQIAFNAALTMGASVLIQAAITAISSWINANENLAESINDVINKYDEQKEAVKNAKSLVDEVVPKDGDVSRYEELSKGVDSLGNNISLTADEYGEYLDIVGRIAETFPELVQGFDSNGNAILSCKGNVDALTDAYNKLGHAANDEILSNLDDVQKDFKNDVDKLSDEGWNNDKPTLETYDILEDMINSKDVKKILQGKGSQYTNLANALKDAKIGDYESIGLFSTRWDFENYIIDCIKTDKVAVQKLVEANNDELDSAASEMKQAAQAMMSDAFDFSDSEYFGISDTVKAIAQQAINNLDGRFYKKIVDEGGNVEDYINSTIDALGNLDENQVATIEAAFDLQTKFNNGEVSYAEFSAAISNTQNIIDHLPDVDGEIKEQINLSLDTNEAEKQYETFVNRLVESGWQKDAAENFAKSLNGKEMQVAFNLAAEGNLDVKNAEELRSQIDEQVELDRVMSFSMSITAEAEGIELLTNALAEANTATGLTEESIAALNARYQDLDEYNPAKLFEETAHGITLNAEAVNNLEETYAESKLEEANSNLSILKDKYDELGVEIQNCTDATKKAQLINQREDIRQQIVNIAEQAAAYEGLTSAYNAWQRAESTGNDRDMYSSVHSAMESIKEELDLGWVDDGTREYFDLIWGDNWSGAGKNVSDYRAQWNTLDDTIEGTTYSLQDFFKTDEDGNLTSKGIYNFFDAVKQKQKELGKNWVQTDKNGNIVSFDFGVDGTKAVADALGISEELVDIFLRASQDCGFVVNFDGTYKQLADLQNDAMAANNKLKELGKTDYTFDFDTRSISDLNSQLEVAKDILADKSFWNADGTFNFDAKGATEAMTIVSTLQATIDSLDDKYIGLTVEDKTFEEPLSLLQDYESQVNTLNQLELNPVYNASSIEVAEENLDNIAQQMIDLPDDVKVKLGIDGIEDVDEMREKIESGEIEIPTTLDIQTNINDNLEDLVKISLLNSGLLDEDVATEVSQELSVKYNISPDSDTQEDAEKLISDNFSGYEGREDIEVDVNANVEGDQNVGSLIDHLGTLSNKEISVIANVFGKVNVEKLKGVINGLDDKTVQAIAKALGAGDVKGLSSIIDGLDDKTVQAIAEAFGYSDVSELKNAIANMDGKTVKAIAQALGISDVESLKSVVNSLDGKTVKAIAEAIGKGDVQSLINTIANLKNKTVTTKVKTVYETVKTKIGNVFKGGSERSVADGTAFADGTTGRAFRSGDWSIGGSGTALAGELGQELVVRNGHFFTVGDDGAEFFDYKPNDIVFNAKQTSELFKYGKLTNGKTRGRAFADGNTHPHLLKDIAEGSIDVVSDDAVTNSSQYGASGNVDGSDTTTVVPYVVQFNADEAISTIEDLNDALEDSASETGLTADEVDDLTKAYGKCKSFNPEKLFEKTANGVKVNKEAVNEYTKELVDSQKEIIAADIVGLTEEYNRLTAEIAMCSNAAERESLINKRRITESKIETLMAEAAMYDVATGACMRWIDAQSQPEDYDNYASIAQFKEHVDDELSRGFLGNASKAYIDILSGYDLSNATVEEYLAEWDRINNQTVGQTGFTISDFFVLDDDGNIVREGIDNFFEGIQNDFNGSVAKFNEETQEYEYDFSEENLKMIQDQWGLGIESIGQMLEAARAAGYDIKFSDLPSGLDLDTSPFEELVEDSKISASEIKKIYGEGIDIDFNYTTTNVADAQAEIDKARGQLLGFMNEDGTINVEVEGYEYAAQIMRTLIIQKQQLETPAVMNIDASALPEAEANAVNALREMTAKKNELEIAVNTGASQEEIVALNQELLACAETVQNTMGALDEETQIKLGYDADSFIDATDKLRRNVDNGTPIKAPFELDNSLIESQITELGKNVTPEVIAEVTGLDVSRITSENGGQEVVSVAVKIGDTTSVDEYIASIQATTSTTTFYAVSDRQSYGVVKSDYDSIIQHCQKALNKLNQLGYDTVTINLDSQTVDEAETSLDSAYTLYNSFRNEDGTIDLTVPGAAEACAALLAAYNLYMKFNEPAIMQISDEELQNLPAEVYDAVTQCRSTWDAWKDFGFAVIAGLDVEDAKTKLTASLNELNTVPKEILASLGIDEATITAAIDQVESMSPTMLASVMRDPASWNAFTQSLKDTPLGVILNALGMDYSQVSGWNGEQLVVPAKIEAEEVEVENQPNQPREEQYYLATTQRVHPDENGSYDYTPQPVDTISGVSAVKVDTEVSATAVVEDVKYPDITDQQLNIGLDVSGFDDALQDGEELRSIVLGLNDADIMTFGKTLWPEFDGVLQDAEEFKYLFESLEPEQLVGAFSNLGLDSALADAESFNTFLDSLTSEQRQVIMDLVFSSDPSNTPEDTVNLKADSTELDTEATKPREATTRLAPDVTPITSRMNQGFTGTAKLTPKLTTTTFTGTIALSGSVTGTSNADGTAFSNGTTGRAFKHGNWGTKDSGTALMGELGPELLVRGGHFYTVGEDSAEFVKYRKNDIIFNAEQTKQIFEKGKITSGRKRGSSFANGTIEPSGRAFAWSAYGSDGGSSALKKYRNNSSGSSYNSSGSGSNSDSYASEEAEEFLETIDWIETKIDRIERAISSLDRTASSTFKIWTVRTSALSNQISKVGEEISLQQQAYERYIAQANSVGLDSFYAPKVISGEINIEDIDNEDLKEKIDSYREWYEKALDARDAIEELRETEAELYQQRFENVAAKFEGILGVIEHEKNVLEEYINQSEARAWLVSEEYYKALEANERETIAELENQRSEQLAELNNALDSGKIAKYSESYYEMVSAIDEVTESIMESNTSLLEYEKNIQELRWEQFDILRDKISRITSETEFLIDLLSSDELYDDKGQFTDKGMSAMGLHGVNYNIEMAQADMAAEEAAKLKKQLESDPYDQDLIDRYNEMIDLQQEHIKNAQSEKDAIKDLVSDGIEAELDALDELIEKRNEALESQKSLYDYQQNIIEQTEEIAALEKQLAAYSGDNSQETMAKRQELEVSLKDSKKELEETEYDKFVEDTERLLDDLRTQYEEVLNARLDNLELLISDMIVEINSSSITISDTLSSKAEEVGYTLSDNLKAIWDKDFLANNLAINNGSSAIKDVITNYGDKFSNAQTTTNTVLGNIAKDMASMISQLNKLAKTNVKSASTSSAAKPKPATSTTTTKPATSTTTTHTSTGGDGKPKVGDKVKFVSGSYYYDSQGTKPLGSRNQGKEVYITNINSASWATHPYHISTGSKLGSGDLGWLKLNQISGYASGKRNLFGDETAWTQEGGREFIVRPSDGAILTPLAKGDSVLNAVATGNIWDMANNPADFIKDNLNIDDIGSTIGRKDAVSIEQNFENIVFNMPNVKNYDELINAISKDKNFERLVNAMTIDRLDGKSVLAKGKAIR